MDNKDKKTLNKYVNLMQDLDTAISFPKFEIFMNIFACFNLYKFCCIITSENGQMSLKIKAMMLWPIL